MQHDTTTDEDGANTEMTRKVAMYTRCEQGADTDQHGFARNVHGPARCIAVLHGANTELHDINTDQQDTNTD